MRPLPKIKIWIPIFLITIIIAITSFALFTQKLEILFSKPDNLTLKQRASILAQPSLKTEDINVYLLSEDPKYKFTINKQSQDFTLLKETFSGPVKIPPEKPSSQIYNPIYKKIKNLVIIYTHTVQPWYNFFQNADSNPYQSVGIYYTSPSTITLKIHLSEELLNNSSIVDINRRVNYLGYLSLYGVKDGWENPNQEEFKKAENKMENYDINNERNLEKLLFKLSQ